MPPRKKARGVSGAAVAAASAAHSAAGDEAHSAAAAGISASDSADAAAASSQRKPPASKRKAAQQEAAEGAADVGSADASQHAAAATAVESAAAAVTAPTDEAMPQANVDADEDFAADAMSDAEEETSAAAASAAPKKMTRKAQLAEAKRLKKAKLAAEEAEAVAAAQAEMLRPKPPACDYSRCPPPHGLHGDVLHSLFEFMRMRELAAVIQLSRGWYGGVRGVPWSSLHAEHQERFSVAEVCASPLAKQIGSLCIRSQVNRLGITEFELKLIHTYMPNLQSLETTLLLKVSDVGPWPFPPNLQKLLLTPKHGGELSTPTVHALLTSIAELSRLKHLGIDFSDTKEVVDFSPLLPIAAQLEEFHVRRGVSPNWYLRNTRIARAPLEERAHQQDFVRQLVNLRRLTYHLKDSESVCHLLRDPVPFTRMEEAVFQPYSPLAFTPDVADRFQHLRSITQLDFKSGSGFDFLSPLTQLRRLSVSRPSVFPPSEVLVGASRRVGELAQALAPCAQLTSIRLHGLFSTAAEMAALCRAAPGLTLLDVVECEELDSISFVSAAPNLTRLRIDSRGPCRPAA